MKLAPGFMQCDWNLAWRKPDYNFSILHLIMVYGINDKWL